MPPSQKKARFSEEQYQSLLDKIAHGGHSKIASDQGAPEPAPKRKKPRAPAAKNQDPDPECAFPELDSRTAPKKRQGVQDLPIMTSMRECSIAVEASDTHISIAFFGARLFTLNEIFAILQYRKYVVFGYKKLWHDLAQTALARLGDRKPRFPGPCRATFFRQGSKVVDRDSLSVMFKYILDALTDHPKKGIVGIFPDDNPEIIADDQKIQSKGDPIVAIRIDALDSAPKALSVESLFDGPLPNGTPYLPGKALKKPSSPKDSGVPSGPPSAPARKKRAASAGAKPSEPAIPKAKSKR